MPRGKDLISPLTLINALEFLESVFICLLPVALVTSITLTGILIFSGASIFAILYLSGRKKLNLDNEVFQTLNSAFMLYIFVFTFTKFVNSGLSEGINALFRYCQDYFVFAWVMFYVLKKDQNTNHIKNAILVAGIISVIYGLLQFFHLDIFDRQAIHHRISGFHKNPYSYAGQLIIFVFFFLSLLSESKNKLFYLLLLTCTIFCVLNSSERAVIFGIAIAIVIYFCLKKVSTKNIFLISGLTLISLILTAIFNHTVLNRIRNVFFPGKNIKPNSRLKLWGIAIALWKKNMLFGAGTFPKIYHETSDLFTFKIWTHAHNVYLQILVTNGILGLISYLYLFYSFIRVLLWNLSKSKYSSCLISIIIAFFIEGIFEYFWGDSEVKYLLLYFSGFVFGYLAMLSLKEGEKV